MWTSAEILEPGKVNNSYWNNSYILGHCCDALVMAQWVKTVMYSSQSEEDMASKATKAAR